MGVIIRKDVPPTLLRLAARQDGVLTHAQAVTALGRTPLRRLVASGAWQCLTRGVYVVGGGEPTPRQRMRAGCLLGGERSAIGGRAALHLAGLGEASHPVQVWVPAGAGLTPRPGWQFTEDGWGRLDHTMGSLPVIRLEETLIDVGQRLAVEDWVTLLAEAARRDLVALPEVIRRIDARPRVAGRAMLREIAADLAGIESTLEWVYRRDVEEAHGLPTGRRQAVIVAGSRCDVHYDGHHLVVELDGRVHLKRVFRDLERDNAHALRGETTLRYGSVDVRGRACHVARQVGGALRLRGWTGLPRRCRSCPPEADVARWRAAGS